MLAPVLARAFAQDVPKGSVGILVSTSPEDSARAEAVASACRAAGLGVAGKEVVAENAVDL